MKLHLEPSAFETLLLDTFERTGIRADIIKKDFPLVKMIGLLQKKIYR
jgi:hypothetical protein